MYTFLMYHIYMEHVLLLLFSLWTLTVGLVSLEKTFKQTKCA